jgi:ferrochelatase
MPQPFDAVLVGAFGGPEGMGDVRPFLANVLRGRRVSPERVEQAARHYEHFGGACSSDVALCSIAQSR